jgi:hypothetical protein
MSHMPPPSTARLIPAFLIAALIGVSMLAATTRADVTVEERISVQGAGLMKIANMNGHSITSVSGNRGRLQSDMEMQSKFIKMLARGAGSTAEIVRLDQDKLYELNLGKKEYTETTFAERRARMEAAMKNAQDAQQTQQQTATKVDESQCEWSEPKAEVRKTGEKATIAGYDAEHVTIIATQSCKDKKTGSVCDFGLTLDQWLAPKFEASSETLAFYKAYAEKVGLPATGSRDFSQRAETMFGRYKGIWTEIAAKMKDQKGYPVKSSFGLGIGGPQCEGASQASAGGGSGVSGPAGLAGALGGALGGMFGKKKDTSAETAAPPPAPMANGLTPLMTVSTELVSINHDSLGAATFEPPVDFKKTGGAQ